MPKGPARGPLSLPARAALAQASLRCRPSADSARLHRRLPRHRNDMSQKASSSSATLRDAERTSRMGARRGGWSWSVSGDSKSCDEVERATESLRGGRRRRSHRNDPKEHSVPPTRTAPQRRARRLAGTTDRLRTVRGAQPREIRPSPAGARCRDHATQFGHDLLGRNAHRLAGLHVGQALDQLGAFCGRESPGRRQPPSNQAVAVAVLNG